MKVFLTKTKNNIEVYYDNESSHAVTHFKENKGLIDFVKKAIQGFDATKQEERFEVDMGEVTGYSDLVVLQEGDETFYAIRELREKYTHFVKNRNPQQTTYITIALSKTKNNFYNLYTA